LRNYASYEEHYQEADAELERERMAGYLLTDSQAELEQYCGGPLWPSKVGVLVKEKQGINKVRLIHDLSRSGVNHLISLPERVVLPRLSEVIDSGVLFLK
jgi:hypothetical protein